MIAFTVRRYDNGCDKSNFTAAVTRRQAQKKNA